MSNRDGLSNRTDDAAGMPERRSVGWTLRLAGVAFVFLPLAMLSAGMAFGIGFSSPSSRKEGSLGWGLNSRDVAELCQDFMWVCLGLGLVLLAGRPRWPSAIRRFFAGFGAVLAALVVAAETEDVGLIVRLLAVAGAGLLLHSLLWDHPPRITGRSRPADSTT